MARRRRCHRGSSAGAGVHVLRSSARNRSVLRVRRCLACDGSPDGTHPGKDLRCKWAGDEDVAECGKCACAAGMGAELRCSCALMDVSQEGADAQLPMQDAQGQDALRAVQGAIRHHLPGMCPRHRGSWQTCGSVHAVTAGWRLWRWWWGLRLRSSWVRCPPPLGCWSRRRWVHPRGICGGIGRAPLLCCWLWCAGARCCCSTPLCCLPLSLQRAQPTARVVWCVCPDGGAHGAMRVAVTLRPHALQEELPGGAHLHDVLVGRGGT